MERYQLLSIDEYRNVFLVVLRVIEAMVLILYTTRVEITYIDEECLGRNRSGYQVGIVIVVIVHCIHMSQILSRFREILQPILFRYFFELF